MDEIKRDAVGPSAERLSYSPREVAERLGLTPKRVRALMDRGLLGCRRVSARIALITQEDLQRFLLGEPPIRRRKKGNQ